jgi:hypothetical protein
MTVESGRLNDDTNSFDSLDVDCQGKKIGERLVATNVSRR